MLYRTLKRIIERGGYDPDEMTLKLDLFYAAGKLTTAQYEELIAMIPHPEPDPELEPDPED